ncbi:hypothetical protein ACH5RR_032824 [Cinchona calisaya]|uniref:Uncharacterized protein n=1 Tax=Cinchona calisaya TaxID=153742 RepID=A0ABD2YMC8_9GENT
MGGYQAKYKTIPSHKVVEGLKYKVKLLQGEVNEIICMRDAEIRAYEREMMVFAIKEAEWKKEKKKLREEVKKLRKRLEHGEERFKGMENELIVDKSGKELQFLGPNFLFEQIREEQAMRDDAIEKWKLLYFAIKIELDDLIQRTNQGEGLCWRAEAEAMLEELQRELMAKEKTTELLQAQIASMKQEESKWKREVDTLRQCLRIACHNKKGKKMAKHI